MKKIKQDSVAKNFVNAEVQSSEKEADVLYQRLGSKWYAFTMVDDEVFMGAVEDESISANHAEITKPLKIV